MSIKDLFKDQQILNVKPEEVYSQVESKDFIDQTKIEKQEFIPDLDFSDPKNFAKFGLAQEYYKTAFSNIQNNYPYDGSEKEITAWKNNLTFLEKYVFDNDYPKTTGYLNLNFTSSVTSFLTASGAQTVYIASSSSPQYLKAFSGPNAVGQEIKDGNIYDVNVSRGGNFDITPEQGNTVEFWLKLKSGLATNLLSCSYGIFDAWNSVTNVATSSYTRFLIDITPSSGFSVTYRGDNSGIQRATFNYNIANLTDWHHYAFTAINTDSQIKVSFYVDGVLTEEITSGSDIVTPYNRGLIANIGAYRYSPVEDALTGSALSNGALPASIDEFRYWKTDRGERDISRYQFDRVYGGANTDVSNTDLGVYYRFNEGIFSETSYDTRDSQILDFSGRVSNATLVNGSLNTRSTGSAIDESGFFDTAEPKDSIIYPTHPLVTNKLNALLEKAAFWDNENGNAIYKSLPSWIVEEDTNLGLQDLTKLTQIIASYFDKLYLQIKALPTFGNVNYYDTDRKPIPFAGTVLESQGFLAPDIFIDASIIEEIKNRDETKIFEETLQDLKNLIYKNIHNNLTYIFKTKGSEKSFRNLIRCFGIDDELIKINLYANNTQYLLENNKKNTTTKRRILNLATTQTYESNLYNAYTASSEFTNFSYIPATFNQSTASLPNYLIPLTFETEIIFPKKPNIEDPNYFVPKSTTISLFGGKTINNNSNNDYTIKTGSNFYGFEAALIKSSNDARGGYFQFTSNTTSEILTSSYYIDLYEGEQWNFAVRLKVPYENIDVVNNNIDSLSFIQIESGTNVSPFCLEFYGVNTVENNVKNEFTLTSSNLTIQQVIDIHNYGKRFYIGSKKNNFTGSVINPTDIHVANARFWFDYITNDEIIEHAKDPMNFGRTNPLQKKYKSINEDIEDVNTLAFAWDFDTITTSDSNGDIVVTDTKPKTNTEGSLFSYNVAKSYPAKLNTAINYDEITKYNYVLSSRNQIPENLYSSNTINIFGESDYVFTKESRPVNLFWSFEKSMYQTITEEMLNMFAGITDFNNLIGAPINLYRDEYRDLKALKTKFFNKVENTPSLEKYLEYYKWIDSSIGLMIIQLIPAGVASSEAVRNMVESHMLERSKVQHNTPIFKSNTTDYGQIKGIKELKYNWKKGSAPTDGINAENQEKTLWLKERAERTNSNIIVSNGTDADSNKQQILNSAVNETNKKATRVYDARTSMFYDKTTYYDRKLARVYDISSKYPETIGDTVELYDTKNIANTLDNTVQLRPILSGSDYERTSLYNQLKANYFKNYQIVQAPGREVNNKYFVETLGQFSNSVNTNFVNGLYNRPLPERSVYDSVIVSRFSSPGSPETQNRGALDKESESLSPYNTLNYRNLGVRLPLNEWLKATGSISSSAPSFHKINRNRLVSAGVNYYDNGFVVHQIPRSDYGYSWIAAATTGVIDDKGQYSSNYPNLHVGDLDVLTASLESGVLIDFAGINDGVITKTANTSSMTKEFSPATSLHTYLLKENGPFYYSSWMQNRNYENELAIQLQKNNKYVVKSQQFISATPSTDYASLFGVGLKNITKKINTFSNYKKIDILTGYYEPTTEWNYPVKIETNTQNIFSTVLLSALGASNGTINFDVMFYMAEYSNFIDKFANKDFYKAISVLPRKRDDTSYKKLFNLYTSTIQDSNEPLFKAIRHSELIFPKKKYVTFGITRNKKYYGEQPGLGSKGYDKNIAHIKTFWRDAEENLLRTNALSGTSASSYKVGSINSLDYAILDSHNTTPVQFSASTLGTSTSSLSPIAFYINNSKRVDSFWNTYQSSSYSFSVSGTTMILTQSSNVFGELTPYKEFELRRLIMLPEGTISTGLVGSTFNYDETKYRVLPRPQLFFTNHFPSLRNDKRYYLSDGIRYGISDYTDNKPWYDSYEKFAEDIRPHSQNYSIIPEFKISDFIEYYFNEKNGDFSTPVDYSYINVDGFDISQEFIQSSNSEILGSTVAITGSEQITIDENYHSSDNIDVDIIEENENLFPAPIGAANTRLNRPTKNLTIKVDAIKKLLPYNGFYPQQRSVQIVDIFQKSFFDLSTDEKMFTDFLQHDTTDVATKFTYTFGSINITVYRIGQTGTPFDQQVNTVLQPFFAPGLLFNSLKSGIAVDWPAFIRTDVGYSGSIPSFYTTASATPLSASAATYVIGSNFDHRFDFNSLLDFNSAIPTNLKTQMLYYVNPTFYSQDIISGSDRNNIRNPLYNIEYPYSDYNTKWELKDPLYTLAINNYLSEIPEFFLQDNKLTGFISSPIGKKTLVSGTTYYMDVVLKKNSSTSLGSNAEHFGPPSLFTVNPTMSAENNTNSDGISLNTYSAHNLVDFDVAYAPYVPSYFFGAAKATLSYTADAEDEDPSKGVSISKIISKINITEENKDLEKSFENATPNNFYTSSIAYNNRMSISASVDFKLITNTFDTTYDNNGNAVQINSTQDSANTQWVIQTKFESPVLDWNAGTYETNLSSGSYQVRLTKHQGFWTTTANIPTTNKGITLTLQKSNQQSAGTPSLAEICGFTLGTKDVGRIAAKKEISEAVVLIPYSDVGNINTNENFNRNQAENILGIPGENGTTESTKTSGPFYYKVEKSVIDRVLNLSDRVTYDSLSVDDILRRAKAADQNNSIIKTIIAMIKYNLPPHINWIRNKNIEPFVIYFAEFKTQLLAEDLSSIWQGLMPSQAKKVELDTQKISHNLTSDEFFHGKKLTNNMKFKIFKVKKRALINYQDLVNNSKDDTRFKFKFKNTDVTSEYSYNYPYDNFSLVEMGKVTLELGLDLQGATIGNGVFDSPTRNPNTNSGTGVTSNKTNVSSVLASTTNTSEQNINIDLNLKGTNLLNRG